MSVRDSFNARFLDGLDRDKSTALLIFLVPGLSLFVIFTLIPISYATFGSFFEWDRFTIGAFAWLDIWIRTFQDPDIINYRNLLAFRYPMGALPQNIIWMIVHVPASTFIGLGLALLFVDLKGRRILRTLVFVGFTTPTIVIGLVLLFIYDPDAGIFNALLGFLGQEHLIRDWLRSSQLAIYALIAGGIWIQTGFSMLLYSSALSNIDPALIESARVDGAGAYRRFWDIIWPLVKPVTAVVVIMGMIWVLRIFAIVYAAGGPSGGPNGIFTVLGIEVYRAAFVPTVEYGKAMVVALLQLIICIPLAWYIADMD